MGLEPVRMRRPYTFSAAFAAFLLLSLLVPYDEDPGAADVVVKKGTGPKTSFAFATDLRFLDFKDEWMGARELVFYNEGFSLPANPGPQPLEQEINVAPGQRILRGTHWVNFTVQAHAVDGSDPLIWLRFRTADGEGSTFRLYNGVTVPLVVNEEMNDWSPDSNTRWRFWLQHGTVAPVDVRLRIEIARDAGALPGYQSYTDRWGDAKTVTAYTEKGRLSDINVLGSEYPLGSPTPNAHPSAAPPVKRMPAVDLHFVRITLHYNSSTSPDYHYRPLLDWRGADREPGTWEESAVKPTVAHPARTFGSFVWEIPVEPRMWDSPFEESTRWGFHVNWHGAPEPSPTQMDGDYHLVIVAVR